MSTYVSINTENQMLYVMSREEGEDEGYITSAFPVSTGPGLLRTPASTDDDVIFATGAAPEDNTTTYYIVSGKYGADAIKYGVILNGDYTGAYWATNLTGDSIYTDEEGNNPPIPSTYSGSVCCTDAPESERQCEVVEDYLVLSRMITIVPSDDAFVELVNSGFGGYEDLFSQLGDDNLSKTYIYGTNLEESVGKCPSFEGSIFMTNDNVIDLFNSIEVGTEFSVI